MIDDFGESEAAKAKILSDARLDTEKDSPLHWSNRTVEKSFEQLYVEYIPALNTLNCDHPQLSLHSIPLRIGYFFFDNFGKSEATTANTLSGHSF